MLGKSIYFSEHPNWQPLLFINKLIKFRKKYSKLFTTLLTLNPGKPPKFCKQRGGALNGD
jgi:hypothetical protein